MLVNQKLGVRGNISLAYYSKNNSEFSFDYFRNIPTIDNSFQEEKNYNIGANLDISIADVILTFRAYNQAISSNPILYNRIYGESGIGQLNRRDY